VPEPCAKVIFDLKIDGEPKLARSKDYVVQQNHNRHRTLVARTTRYTMLLHLPHGHSAEPVRDALARSFAPLPAAQVRSLTWDRGIDLARHDEFTETTKVPVFFCDPAATSGSARPADGRPRNSGLTALLAFAP